MIDVKAKIKEVINDYPEVELSEKDNNFVLTVSEEIFKPDLLTFLEKLYTLERELAETGSNNIILNLKNLTLQQLTEAIKFSLKDEDLVDPVMILNITNLIKIYNTLDDSFFENEYVYVKDLTQLLDLRMNLQEELEEFIQKLSIYFLSLFKSFNKDHYTPLDVHQPLPKVFKTIFMSNDLLTLSGIFAVSKPFSTDKCVYLDDGIDCILNLQAKSYMSANFIKTFLEGFSNGTSEQPN